MNLLAPQPWPFSYDEWKKQPFAQRVKMLCAVWAMQGYGGPVSVYGFYILKLVFYVGMWLYFCSFSSNLGAAGEIQSWWFVPEALLKAILWSMVYEGVGLGAGSGPLTARYMPPFGGVLYFVRPGTIKMPYLEFS